MIASKLTRVAALLVPGVALACGGPSDSTLFTDVRIVDGTGAAAYAGAVRVAGDSIVAVGALTPAPGESVVDGGGAVLAPGFIDTHSHHDRGLLEEMRSARAAVSQGITTIVVGQDGGSDYPLADFFAHAAASPPAVNVASYTGHASLRRRVMGEDLLRAATPAEVDSMAALLRVDMEAGSLGLSTGLEYSAGFNSTTEEVVALARVAAEYGGRYISHIRSEDRRFWEAVDEILRIGAEAGIPVQISHMKLAMTSLWGRADELVERLEAARRRGIAVTADVYPYTYWQSTMRVLVPDGNFTRDAVDFALREVSTPDGIIFGRFSPEPRYVGRTLADIAAERGEDPVTAYLALLEMAYGSDAPDDARESIVARSMTEEDIGRLYRWRHTNVSSDGELAGPHPRGYGSFTRVLRTEVRERGALSLEEAVHRMTGLAARHMGISDRGVIRAGARADLVLLDPETVTDHADFEEPQVASSGILGVWVNGARVWDGTSVVPTAYPGRVLRREAGPDWSAVDAVFGAYDRSDVPGCALGVVRGGRLEYARGYGMANLEHAIPITPRTVFRTGSVGKQFTAAAIAIAASEDAISLDDPIRKWIPELPEYPVEPTIRHAVHHTSGVRDYLTLMTLRGLRDDDWYTEAEVRDVVSRQRELNFDPGSEYLYSNSGYFLLGEIVREATGLPLKEYARTRIFEPLGMERSHFHDDHNHLVQGRAAGYAPEGEGFRLSQTTLDMVGDGGVFTSIEDLALWMRALDEDGLAEGLNAVLESRVPLSDGSPNDYAFGQRVGTYRGVATVGHGGSFVGFRTAVARFPDRGVSIAVTCNRSDTNPSGLALEVADVVLAGHLGPSEREAGGGASSAEAESDPAPVAVGDAAGYTGVFYSPELDVEYHIGSEEGVLRLRAGAGIDRELRQRAPDHLVAGQVELRFRRTAEGAEGFDLDAGRVKNLSFARVAGSG
jgi:N-acyl-D-amino-acid deacylase